MAPDRTSKLRSSTATVAPKRFVSERISIAAKRLLPARLVALHHAVSLRKLEASGEASAERAERLLIARAYDEQVVVALPGRLGREAQRGAVAEAHRPQVGGEAD